jgi:hypothetical protein
MRDRYEAETRATGERYLEAYKSIYWTADEDLPRESEPLSRFLLPKILSLRNVRIRAAIYRLSAFFQIGDQIVIELLKGRPAPDIVSDSASLAGILNSLNTHQERAEEEHLRTYTRANKFIFANAAHELAPDTKALGERVDGAFAGLQGAVAKVLVDEFARLATNAELNIYRFMLMFERGIFGATIAYFNYLCTYAMYDSDRFLGLIGGDERFNENGDFTYGAEALERMRGEAVADMLRCTEPHAIRGGQGASDEALPTNLEQLNFKLITRAYNLISRDEILHGQTNLFFLYVGGCKVRDEDTWDPYRLFARNVFLYLIGADVTVPGPASDLAIAEPFLSFFVSERKILTDQETLDAPGYAEVSPFLRTFLVNELRTNSHEVPGYMYTVTSSAGARTDNQSVADIERALGGV